MKLTQDYKECRIKSQARFKQTELAARLEKPHSYISWVENRQIRVDVMELRQICQAIGISFRSFVNALEDELEISKIAKISKITKPGSPQ